MLICTVACFIVEIQLKSEKSNSNKSDKFGKSHLYSVFYGLAADRHEYCFTTDIFYFIIIIFV